MKHLAAVLLLAPCLALAQQRPIAIPQDARAGQIRHVEQMVIEIDGTRLLLAPGAQIRDDANRLIVPMAIPADAKAKYLIGADGLVQKVWILTPEEAQQN